MNRPRITACLFISLDGRTEDPQTWHVDYVDQQLVDAVLAQYTAATRILLGRRTYEAFASSWGFRPQDSPLAVMINTLPKTVLSNTLTSADWPGCTLRSGDIHEIASDLRQDNSGDVIVPGSVALVRALLAADELDRLELMMHPRLVGVGAQLFDETSGGIDLHLASASVFETGVQHMVFELPTRP